MSSLTPDIQGGDAAAQLHKVCLQLESQLRMVQTQVNLLQQESEDPADGGLEQEKKRFDRFLFRYLSQPRRSHTAVVAFLMRENFHLVFHPDKLTPSRHKELHQKTRMFHIPNLFGEWRLISECFERPLTTSQKQFLREGSKHNHRSCAKLIQVNAPHSRRRAQKYISWLRTHTSV